MRGSSDSNVLDLEIYATDLTDLHALRVTVTFPSDLLQFDGYRQGSFLEPSELVAVSSSGQVVVTQERTAAGGVSGSGTVLTLVFTTIRNGTGHVGFVDSQLLDSRSAEIAGVEWIGGRVEVAF